MEPIQHPQLPPPHGTPFLRIFALLVFAFAIVVLSVLGTYWYLNRTSQPSENNINPTGVVCTMEAKLCPDGSSVGRSGPNCEFAPCPSGSGVYRVKDFEYQIPKGWIVHEDVANDFLELHSPDFAVDEKSNGGFRGARISVLRGGFMVRKPIDYDAYVSGLKKGGYATNDKKIIVGGLEARQFDFNISGFADTQVHFDRNWSTYTITFFYPDPETKNEYTDDFDELLQSFKLLR